MSHCPPLHRLQLLGWRVRGIQGFLKHRHSWNRYIYYNMTTILLCLTNPSANCMEHNTWTWLQKKFPTTIIFTTTDSKPPRPIIVIGQSKIGINSHIIFFTVLFTSLSKPSKHAGGKPFFSWAATAYIFIFLHPILMCKVTLLSTCGDAVRNKEIFGSSFRFFFFWIGLKEPSTQF